MKILFLGSPNFAKVVLEGILQAGHEVVAVVCQPDRPASRGQKLQMPEVKPFALEKGIPVLQFEKVNANLEEIKKLNFDLFVTASFGQILSREFLSLKMGVNVHPSLLPQLRGATPIQTALLQNLKSTGVTIQRMVYEMDAGDIIEQQQVEIDDEDDYTSLENKLSRVSVVLLNKALEKIQNNTAVFTPQIGQPTFTKLITKQDGKLDFNQTALENLGKVRALAHNPGAYFEINGQRVKVLKAIVVADNLLYQPKEIIKDKNNFIIKCKDSALQILSLISPSGKVMDGKAFLNGLRNVEKVD